MSWAYIDCPESLLVFGASSGPTSVRMDCNGLTLTEVKISKIKGNFTCSKFTSFEGAKLEFSLRVKMMINYSVGPSMKSLNHLKNDFLLLSLLLLAHL